MIVFFTFVFVICFLIYLKQYYFVLFIETLPCMPQQFLVGNIFQAQKESFLSTLARMRQRFGNSFALYFGPSRFVCVNSVEHIEQIFTRRDTYERDTFIRTNVGAILPKCLRTLSGIEWQTRKRIIISTFRQSKLPNYIPSIVHTIDGLVEYWRTETRIADESGCMSPMTNRFSFELSVKILLGETSVSKISIAEFSEAFFKFQKFNEFMFNSLLLPTSVKKLYLKSSKDYRQSGAILRSHIDHLTQNVTNTETSLLASLLEAEEQQLVSKNDIFSEIIDILSTANSVTVSAIGWILYYLSTNEQIQTNIKQELNHVGIDRESILTVELINQLVYVECVCKEVLRHSPEIAPFAARTALKNDFLGNDDDRVFIRKNDMVIICQYNIHHDPHHWKLDPYQFLPERFLNEDKNHHRYAYIPFGGGHRACIAQYLAWLELKLIVARLMLFVTIHRDPHVTIKTNATLGQDDSLNLTGVYVTFDNETAS